MLSQHLEKSFLDLRSVNGYTLFFHLLHLLLIQLHQFNIWVSLDGLHLIVDDLVMTVDSIDVLEQTFEYRHGRRYRSIDE